MLRHLLLILLLCVPCFAAATQKYVDFTLGTDDAGHGGAVGAGAWKTLAYAISQTGDITAVSEGWQINCSNGIDTTAFTIAPGTQITDADSPLYIKGDATYTLRVTDAIPITITGAGNAWYRIGNLTIETVSPAAHARYGIYLYSVTTVVLSVDHCTMKGHAHATYYQDMIFFNDASSTLYCWDNLIYNVGVVDHAEECGIKCYSGTSYVSNCTVVGGKYGFYARQGTDVFSNCLATGCLTYDFYDESATSTAIHCMGEKAWITSGGIDTTTDGNLESQNYGGFFTATYRLTAGNPAINAGTDLSAGTPVVNDDIDGYARTGTYDVGADEFPSAYFRTDFNGGFDGGFDQ